MPSARKKCIIEKNTAQGEDSVSKLFGRFDPTRVGPGVPKNAPQKKRFFLFFEIYFRKFTKIFLLNLIYVLICLPIITIGPATAGLTYCMRNFAREDYADISDFFDQFKKNFWQSIVVNLILTIGFGAIIFGLVFYSAAMKAGNHFASFGFVAAIVAGVIFLFMSYYLFVMMVTFRLKIRQLFKNAFIFAFAGLGSNLIITFFLAILYGAFFLYGIWPAIMPLYDPNAPLFLSAVCFSFSMYLCFIPTLGSLIINFNVYPHVKKFMIDPALAEKRAMEKEAAHESIFNDEGEFKGQNDSKSK